MKFDAFLKAVLDEAGREARQDRSSTVEAQHLLLALAASAEPTTHRILALVGLDHAAIRAALDGEFERSLRAAGVSLGASGIPRPSQSREGSPALGSSVRLALERGVGAARTAPQPLHLLLGIVQARVGTVPRVLDLAGADLEDLVTRIRESVSTETETALGSANR
jgi:D-alanyl-D-alanine carboxypeptidase